MTSGVVLIGPPAAGKDTITALVEARSDLRLLLKVKAGSGRSAGYHRVTDPEFDALTTTEQLISTVHRYGNRYGVRRSDLAALRAAGHVPVVHTASPAEARTLARTRMTVGLLWCPREVAEERLRLRDPMSVGERLAIWDELQGQLAHLRDEIGFVIDTSRLGPSDAADALLGVVASMPGKGAVRRQLAEVRPDLSLVVPVVTPRRPSGEPDLEGLQQHVQRLRHLGCRVLVTGSTGHGDELSPRDRAMVRHAALEVCPQSLAACYWGGEDLEAATERMDARLLVPGGRGAVNELRRQFGASTMVYSHPRLGYELDADGARGWIGAKLSKVGLPQLASARAVDDEFVIWHGSAASATESFRAGADAVVAAELNAFAGSSLPCDPKQLQDVIDEIRTRWPRGDRQRRNAWLETEAQRALTT